MKKIRTKPFPTYNPIGKEEADAVLKVMQSGLLSDFIGRDCEKFQGRPQIVALEKNQGGLIVIEEFYYENT